MKKEKIKSRKFYRHKSEKIVFAISIIVSIVIFVILSYLGYAATLGSEQNNIILQFYELDSSFEETVMKIGGYISIIVMLFLLVSIYIAYEDDMLEAEAHDVYITDKQLAVLIKAEKEYAEKLGMKKLPKLFISEGNTYIKVFGATIIKSFKIIRISSENIIATANEGYYLAKFAIAKHLAYKYMGYYNPALVAFSIFAKWIPILSHVNNRVKSYSTDKIVAELMGKDEAIKSIVECSVNIYFLPYMNMKDYIENTKKVVKNKYMMLKNILSDEPIPAYRIEALRSGKDGKLF